VARGARPLLSEASSANPRLDSLGVPYPRLHANEESGGSDMRERTPNPESEETQDEKPEAHDAAAGSPAERAKEREREMEESGEENAA